MLQADAWHFKVFEVIGLGGAGKTELLSEMRTRAAKATRAGHVLWVPLEAENSATETGPLKFLREQTNFDCHLFDTGLLTYLSSTGQALPADRGGRLTQSFAFRTLDAARAVAHIPLPLTFAVEVYRAGVRRVTRAWYYDESEFEEIDALRLDPSALRERLPHWLGIDILRRIDTTGDPLVLFYDSYEKQKEATRSARAPWLRELIGTIDRGVHVIATRERLRWDADWAGVVQPVEVKDLPMPEARELIRSHLGVVPLEAEEQLLQASRRIPFYLEAAVRSYREIVKAGDVRDMAKLPSSPTESLDRMLGHLPAQQHVLAVALGSIQVFDAALFSDLIHDVHLPVSTLDFEHFAQWFFVEEISTGTYKTHDLLTDFVRKTESHSSTRREALVTATAALGRRCLAGGTNVPQTVLPIFRNVVVGWLSIPDVPPDDIEALVDIGYYLHDAGYWQELGSIAPDGGMDPAHPVAVAVDFFAAIGARRTSGIDHALQLLERLEPRASTLGRHQRSVEIELAYLNELAGQYDNARIQFRQLNSDAMPFDPVDRTHVRARLYHSDILITDGEFQDAARLLLDAYERVGVDDPLTWAELVRHRGHAFRFSFMFEQAEHLYREALRLTDDAPGLTGKLHTNIAESACWHEPEVALEAAAVSAEINLRLGNRIELTKSDAARGIALARLEQFEVAREAVSISAQQASEVGYTAGIAFALQAEAIVEGLASDAEALRRAEAKLDQVLVQLGTYAHLSVAPICLAGDDVSLTEALADFGWLDPTTVETRLRAALPNVTR